MKFHLNTDYSPKGDQPRAIDQLVDGIDGEERHQVLLGVTGSGKTFTMANVIERVQRPALVIAHNKTLAAQLYGEFRELFPDNSVEYFVSYYDYYQPEAYLPITDTYIEKDASINEEIDKMRHSATYSLLERNDVVIVASVSCIYGLGSPEAYYGMLVHGHKGEEMDRDVVISKLVEIQYKRSDIDFHRGTFRVRGDVIEVFPAYEESRALRLEFFGDVLEDISVIDPLRGVILEKLEKVAIYPGSHYVTPDDVRSRAVVAIKEELAERLKELRANNMLVEAQRLEQRTNYDLEMMEEMGYCTGIENYSRHMVGRKPGEPPPTLLDYFPEEFLVFIDESHATIPQLGAMYKGDKSRKSTLIEHGFRLPSALDNRPLCFEEFEEKVNQVIYVSATPGPYEKEKSKGWIAEQIIRPTGLVDPEIEVKSAKDQVDDLYGEIKERVKKGDRVLITTLTKRMAEDLTEYYTNLGLKVKYLHSDIATLDRFDIIRELRMGKFDTLIGINLLREGLDLPEVSLVAILDADKEGFLRGETALIQTCGRAARNLRGKVILYADKMTRSMNRCITETNRRRKIQTAFNKKNNITPEGITKDIRTIRSSIYEKDYITVETSQEEEERLVREGNVPKLVEKLRKEMFEAAKDLEFEKAADIRDKILKIERMELFIA